MRYLPFIIIPFIMVFILPLTSMLLQKNARKKEHSCKSSFIMRASKSFGVALVLLTIFFGVTIVLLNIFEQLELIANVALTAFLIFMVIGCIQMFRQKIVVSENHIIYTPIIGKTKQYNYEEIKEVIEIHYSYGIIKYRAYTEQKAIFTFANTAVGANLLLQKFKEQGVNLVIK